jgi:hypothetical protein
MAWSRDHPARSGLLAQDPAHRGDFFDGCTRAAPFSKSPSFILDRSNSLEMVGTIPWVSVDPYMIVAVDRSPM